MARIAAICASIRVVSHLESIVFAIYNAGAQLKRDESQQKLLQLIGKKIYMLIHYKKYCEEGSRNEGVKYDCKVRNSPNVNEPRSFHSRLQVEKI